MANPKHLEMIRQGVGTFHRWREDSGTRQIDLSDADLSELDLRGIDLEKANLAGANLEGVLLDEANLAQANLQGAILKKARIENARFPRANLSHADLSEALARNADFTQATISHANLRQVNLERARLSSANLERAVLRGAHLSGAGFHSANLSHADLTGATAVNTGFSKASLRYALFDRASCHRANFAEAVANHVSFVGATLNQTSMAHAVLRRADLRDANLGRASLESARLQRARIDGADFFEANLTAANMGHVLGAPNAKHLDTVRITSPVRYLDSCQRRWPEKYGSWEVIRTIGNLRLFAVSYSLLAFLLTTFYVVALYNEKIMIARQWAQRARGSGNKATQLLAEEILGRLNPFLFSLDTVLLFGSTIVLVVASIIYTFGCPAEIKDFTRPQWCYQLNRSLVHYWSLAWKRRGWRMACGLFYLIGGAGFVPIIGYKLILALICIWKYGNIVPLGQ